MVHFIMVKNYQSDRQRFRITVPKELRKLLGKTAITHSLAHLPNEPARLRQVEKFNTQYKTHFAALRSDQSAAVSVKAREEFDKLR